ncbi:hypothetical protein M948_20715 [Virgibacillus sp. CM-4]|uniref:DnaD domain-containing protein n=1 Tax=Virgibacillus sp. CM-4 TaxID=1354277 RepID=UPI0003887F96|nr:DnaD domain protein [Virgibacillus sp. CM-4]EQB34806.1 hypothetical protein M948_20715 [Virgibacillus sp. CM-4]
MQGWIKLHRQLLGSPIFQNEKLLKVFVYCLLKATHSDHQQLVGKQTVSLKPGQFVFGRRKAAMELDMKESTVRDYMKVLKNDNAITITPTNKFSIITIVNWEVYQSKEDNNRQQNDNKMTAERQQNDTNKNEKNDKEISTTTNDAIVFYQNNFGIIRPHMTEEILGWINDFGDDMVIEALTRSLDRNKPNWGYAKSILQSWANKGIKNLEQAKAEEIEHKNQQSTKKPYYPRQSKEVVPEWFNNRNRKIHEQESSEEDQEDVAAMLARFKAGGG